MGLSRVFAIVVLWALLASCMGYKCQDIYPEDAIPSYDLDSVMNSMARELCGSVCTETAKPAAAKTILVTDFVPVGGRTTERNGAYLGEIMRGAIIKQCCTKVLRTDFVGHFAFSHDGTIMTTDPILKAEGDRAEKPFVVVGSYMASQDELNLISNLIDPVTGSVLLSARREGSTYCFMGSRSVWFLWKH